MSSQPPTPTHSIEHQSLREAKRNQWQPELSTAKLEATIGKLYAELEQARDRITDLEQKNSELEDKNSDLTSRLHKSPLPDDSQTSKTAIEDQSSKSPAHTKGMAPVKATAESQNRFSAPKAAWSQPPRSSTPQTHGFKPVAPPSQRSAFRRSVSDVRDEAVGEEHFGSGRVEPDSSSLQTSTSRRTYDAAAEELFGSKRVKPNSSSSQPSTSRHTAYEADIHAYGEYNFGSRRVEPSSSSYTPNASNSVHK